MVGCGKAKGLCAITKDMGHSQQGTQYSDKMCNILCTCGQEEGISSQALLAEKDHQIKTEAALAARLQSELDHTTAECQVLAGRAEVSELGLESLKAAHALLQADYGRYQKASAPCTALPADTWADCCLPMAFRWFTSE